MSDGATGASRADGAGEAGAAGGGLRWKAVVGGAGADLLVTLPAAIIGNALKGGDEGSNVAVFFAVVVLLVGPFVGGWVAGRGQRQAPLTHGAAAAALAWLVIVLISVVRELVSDRGVPVLTFVLLGCIGVSLGLLGAYFAFRRDVRADTAG